MKNGELKYYKLETEYSLSSDSFENVFNPVIFQDKIVFLDPVVDIIYGYGFDGKQIFTIDNSEGKGRFRPAYLYYDNHKNLLAVVNGYNNDIQYFDENGNLKETEKSESGILVFNKKYIGEKTILNYAKPEVYEKDSGIENKVSLITNNSEIELYESKFRTLNNFNLTGSLITEVSEADVYVTARSIDEYSIMHYDSRGELKKAIKKKYNRIKKNNDEAVSSINSVNHINEILQTDSKDDYTREFLYFNAIEFMAVRNDRELWVRTHDFGGSFYDIYDEKDNIIAQCRVEDNVPGNLLFFDEEIFGFLRNDSGKYELTKFKLSEM